MFVFVLKKLLLKSLNYSYSVEKAIWEDRRKPASLTRSKARNSL